MILGIAILMAESVALRIEYDVGELVFEVHSYTICSTMTSSVSFIFDEP
jgi:hypothetical protein